MCANLVPKDGVDDFLFGPTSSEPAAHEPQEPTSDIKRSTIQSSRGNPNHDALSKAICAMQLVDQADAGDLAEAVLFDMPSAKFKHFQKVRRRVVNLMKEHVGPRFWNDKKNTKPHMFEMPDRYLIAIPPRLEGHPVIEVLKTSIT